MKSLKPILIFVLVFPNAPLVSKIPASMDFPYFIPFQVSETHTLMYYIPFYFFLLNQTPPYYKSFPFIKSTKIYIKI